MNHKSDPETLFRGAGVEVSPGMSIDEILDKSGLNWEVVVERPFYGYKVGKEVQSRGRSIVYRTDTMQDLTYSSNDWKPYQNRRFLSDFSNFCDRNGLQIERIGYLPSGEDQFSLGNMVFITALVPEDLNGVFMLDKDDVTVMRVLAYNYHTYRRGSGFLTMAERLICTNGMTILTRGMVETMKHIQSHIGDRQYVSTLLESLKVQINSYRENLKLLASTPVKPGEAFQLFKHLLGSPKKPDDKQEPIVKACFSIFQGDMDEVLALQGVDLGMNILSAYQTYYGILQALTAYKTHFSGDVSSSSYLQSRIQGKSAKLVNAFYLGLVEKAKKQQQKQQMTSVGIYY
ncbi:MAG: DUF932 domain-containing protein [Brasilonema sp.]